ncbi:MAG: hypothetical protein Q7S35_13695 [Candidatus Limnocylindrales bacterium]|nr:hypothetical protein [Candidatus Limnocylindrales bacterium]
MVRRAGRARLADGTQLVWSVADGRRGRRWRAMTTRDGALTGALLLEVGVDGRPARLELATAAGLLTLHPEPSGSLHGNAVTADGVRHLTFAWSGEHELEVDGLPIASAVTARRLAGSTAVGEGRTVPAAAVAPDLSVREGARRYVRVDDATWRIEGEGDRRTLTIDERGLPVGSGEAGDEAGEWPLELEPHG